MNKKTINQQQAAPVTPYILTDAEREVIEAHLAKHRKKTPSPRMKTSVEDGADQVVVDHPNFLIGRGLLMEALGTTDVDFFVGVVHQLINAGTRGQKTDVDALNFMLSMVKGVQPRDQVETMLAAQMAAIHSLTMTFARRLAHVENIPQQDSAERTLNKLARTFAAQVEALKRYRSNGEQKVAVEHVTVNQGGQAIVGNITHGEVGAGEKQQSTP
ncbi:MAG: hypothetical protein EXR70_16655 [Deltaproteobacteria bacterium]|nr:hypothetical protein [Deltaproteobacteria bacterium]